MVEWALGLGAVVVAGLAAVCVRQRARLAELSARLEVAASDLQRLQESCSRFAPSTVVDRLLTDGLTAAAVRERLDPTFTLIAQPAAPIKGIAEPIVTFAVI